MIKSPRPSPLDFLKHCWLQKNYTVGSRYENWIHSAACVVSQQLESQWLNLFSLQNKVRSVETIDDTQLGQIHVNGLKMKF